MDHLRASAISFKTAACFEWMMCSDMDPIEHLDTTTELGDLVRSVGANRLVLAHGIQNVPSGVIAVNALLDLREPSTPFPHDALRVAARPAALVYQ